MGGGLSFAPTAFAAFIPFLGILIFVHELGHFLAAKYFNIKVLKFSLGFGPALFKYTRGETTYQVAVVPLGGYVKMLGDAPGDEVEPEDQGRSFSTVPIYQRAIVAFAGPLMNLVFPIVCVFGYYVLGPTVLSPVVGQLEYGSAAERGGLQPDDRILAIGDQRIWDFDQMTQIIRASAGVPLRFTIERQGAQQVVEVTPRSVDGYDLFGDKIQHGQIGVAPARLGTRVGVDGPRGAAAGFVTGDRVLKVGDVVVSRIAEVQAALVRAAGGTVKVLVARPAPLSAGDLLLAQREDLVTIDVAVPAGAQALADLDLASADSFVRFLEPDGPAARAGMRPGDRVIAVEGQRVAMFYSLVNALQRAEAKPVRVTVSRMGEHHELTIVSAKKVLVHGATMTEKPYYDAGLGLGALPRSSLTANWPIGDGALTETAALSLWESASSAVTSTVDLAVSVATSVAMLFTGGVSHKALGGPVMLFQVAAEAAELGLGTYLRLLALISVNLGIFNLLPIPILDGGHLMFCAIEAIKRRPVSTRVREMATLVGLLLLVLLIAVALTNDVTRAAS